MSSQCASGPGNHLVDNHPCFSKEAQHQVARMHLAVAPACNIQCHYCNRKYDCSNESRPGVVSDLLMPQEAVRKVAAVKSKIPQLTVVGIAGPGDPLANPERTFETCRLVKESFPDLMLCLSTNGLNLPNQVDTIAALGIHHVTLTLNALDPAVGAQIYPWIFWKNRRIRGLEAAKILIDQQMNGIAKLAAKNILIKINSVLIPGVNDHHLPEVHERISSEGVFLHNIMPLISAPEHGTYYGLMGQKEPFAEALQEVQSHCGGVELMTHCRQCRADAVGMLGEDRNAEFSKTVQKEAPLSAFRAAPPERRIIPIQMAVQAKVPPREEVGNKKPLRIAIASSDGIHVNLHFGHTDAFFIFERSPNGATLQSGQVSVSRYCFGDDECGERENALEVACKLLQGCDAVFCERIGFTPWNRLKSIGVKPVNDYADWSIEAAIQDFARKIDLSAEENGPAEQITKHPIAVGG